MQHHYLYRIMMKDEVWERLFLIIELIYMG